MKARWQPFWGLGLVALLFAGCATHHYQVDYAARVQASDVDEAVVRRMENRAHLRLEDIEHLSAKGVSKEVIMGYITEVGTIYSLSTDDVDRLRKAHVDKEVIDFLLATPLEQRRQRRRYSYGGDYLYNDPYYPHYPHYYHYGYYPYGSYCY